MLHSNYLLLIFVVCGVNSRSPLRAEFGKDILIPIIVNDQTIMVESAWEDSPVYEYDYNLDKDVTKCPEGFLLDVLGVCRDVW